MVVAGLIIYAISFFCLFFGAGMFLMFTKTIKGMSGLGHEAGKYFVCFFVCVLSSALFAIWAAYVW